MTQIFNAEMQNKKEGRKLVKNGRIRAVSLSLNPAIQLLTLHMYVMFKNGGLHTCWKKTDTNVLSETDK